MVWSVVVAKLPLIGFDYTTDQLFWLAALPGLSGATFRIFYSFMVPIFGGRLWTTLSTASLLIPAFGIGYAVQNPDTPYFIFLVLALLCGFGGGNFASSMSNIGFFFPKAQKGNALALNAGLGNLGVSVMQFAVPLVITAGVFGALGGTAQVRQGRRRAVAAERRLHLGAVHHRQHPARLVRDERHRRCQGQLCRTGGDLPAQAQLADVLALHRHLRFVHRLFRRAAAARQEPVPDVNVLKYVFLGPLVGAISRAATGWVADRWGGARVTFWVFIGMIVGALGVIHFLEAKDFNGFLGAFIFMFFVTGVGNASTFQMIPNIMRQEVPRLMPELDAAQRTRQAEKESAAIVGFTSAIAAYGAFFIPRAFGMSISATGTPQAALYGFILFYASCAALTWFIYTRKGGPAARCRAWPHPSHCPRLPRSHRMSHLLDRLTFFRQKKEQFSDGHGVTTAEARDWEDGYRKRWQHDKIVRSTHGVNCTGSCSWKIYVKGGIITWETQQTDYPRTRPELPNHEPRGCPRGASYSWYIYSAQRLKYPLIRKRLVKLWREARPPCRRSRPGPRSSLIPPSARATPRSAATAASCARPGTR
jgi:nitrate/nitrite transporter NarK